MKTLAVLGGIPVRTAPFPAYNVIGDDEKRAVMAVLDTGVLSKYLGARHEDFLGGPEVRAFESEWANAFGVDYAVAVNSATSGLYAAMGAAGVSPGDEVIVPPLSMSASATAAIVWGGVPVFCDIEPENFTPSPKSIAKCITARTKAIMVVHLLGHPTEMDPIMEIAEKHGIVVIEDCAQSIHALYHGRPTGALAHIGVFSLNYHKHIHTGEGGVCTTNDSLFAERLQLLRNHAEAVVTENSGNDLVNMVGYNFRLGEMEAAIGRSLLKKSRGLVEKRQANVAALEQKIGFLPGMAFAKTAPDCTHAHYAHALHYDASVTGVPRELMIKAIRAELPPTEMRDEAGGALIGPGYTKPLYRLPMYRRRIAFGNEGYPFTVGAGDSAVQYDDGSCPNAEHASRTMVTHEMMRPPMTDYDLDDVAAGFHKVFENLDTLRDAHARGAV